MTIESTLNSRRGRGHVARLAYRPRGAEARRGGDHHGAWTWIRRSEGHGLDRFARLFCGGGLVVLVT